MVMFDLFINAPSPPNDPSSATRPTGCVDCNQNAMAGFAAALDGNLRSFLNSCVRRVGGGGFIKCSQTNLTRRRRLGWQ